MAKKKEVETKKNSTKKTESKRVVKKEEKVEIVKENKFKLFMGKVGSKLKAFFNNPAPIIIALIILNFFSLLYITRYEGHNQIYVGNITKGVSVGSIHFFTNNDINYFYASTGTYLEEDKDVYSYEMGYYVKKGNEFIPFATRSGALDKATSLASLVKEFSGWEIVEAYNAEYFFKHDVVPHMSDLYFIINASSEQGSSKADVHYEFKVNNTKVTK